MEEYCWRLRLSDFQVYKQDRNKYRTIKGTYRTLSVRRHRTYYYKARVYTNVTKSGKKYKVYALWSSAKVIN